VTAPARRTIEVSPARPEEYAVLGALTVAAYVVTSPPVRDEYRTILADVAQRAAHRDRVVLAAREDGRPIGCATVVLSPSASVNRLPEDVAELRMLAVDPAAQGRSAGRALVEAALELARDLGKRRCWLDTQEHMHAARHLYESLGFVRVPQRDRDVPGTSVHLLAYELELT
jgi:ribosomal protein S18 acetylase RimI-like enzyme